MGLRINQNIEATNAYRNLSVTQNQLSKSMERLSSGLRINRAADDASGLVRSEGLRAEIGGTKQAIRNAQDATPASGTVAVRVTAQDGYAVIAVVDDGGHLLAFARMDGARPARPRARTGPAAVSGAAHRARARPGCAGPWPRSSWFPGRAGRRPCPRSSGPGRGRPAPRRRPATRLVE